MFQSSRMSWSSKIIAVGTVDISHRISGSPQECRYSRSYSAKLTTSSGGRSPCLLCRRRLHTALLVGRKLVGVELVAEQDQRIGPLVDRTAGHPGGIRVQRVVLQLLLDLLDFGLRVAARPEDGAQSVRARGSAGADDAGRELRERLVVDGPHRRAVDADLVLGHAVWGQPGHQDKGEMVALHLEGPRRAAENLDGAGVFGLHPHQGGGVGNVPQCRAEEQSH